MTKSNAIWVIVRTEAKTGRRSIVGNWKVWYTWAGAQTHYNRLIERQNVRCNYEVMKLPRSLESNKHLLYMAIKYPEDYENFFEEI